jgi:hypothetical protein
MPDDGSKLTCEEFQSQLAELIESGADIANHPHAKVCEGCCGFIRDLYRFAENFGPRSDDLGSDDWSEST